MAHTIGNRKCRNSQKLFLPDSRNQAKQKFCSEEGFRKASKAASQKRWLAKEENRNYFKGSDNVKRVQEWRKEKPRYWRRGDNALQDLLTAQSAVLVGLIATFTGDTLQDYIASTARNMQQLGNDILQSSTHFFEGGSYDSSERKTKGVLPQTPNLLLRIQEINLVFMVLQEIARGLT